MKLFRVLHLSDIHIGDTYMASNDIAYKIIADIENESIENIRSVIVTGDIFEGRCGEDKSIISEAIGFFNIIFEELKKTTNITKSDFLFVPGNHDILRNDVDSKQWTKYRNFLKGFYGSIPAFYDPDNFALIKIYEDSRMVFVGFNSCGLRKEAVFEPKLIKDIEKIEIKQFDECGIEKEKLVEFIKAQTKNETFVDFGEISPKQLLNVKRELKGYDDYNIVAFFHHHFYLFPEVYSKYGDSSLIRNYTHIIRQLQQAHVKTVLHGHKHFDLERPLITDSYYENAKNVINVIAGGSVGTSRIARHTFNIVDFYDKDSEVELIQRKFVYNNDHLEPIIIRQIPPKSSDTDSSIKLYNVFELNNPELFSAYTNAVDKINIVADDYTNMLKWLENVFIGFEEIHKTFEKNSLCVFFLLYAMNYRVLRMKQILGKEKIKDSYFDILNDLLFDSVYDIGFNKEKYLKIFAQSDLNRLKDMSDEIFDSIQNKNAKSYFCFSMIGIFITDIFLMLRYYAGSFYNEYIQYKVNIKLDETEFHQSVPVQKIMIHSDVDRRSAYIDMRCDSATSHKLAVLFVKEFELIISKFEDYFKTVGLKLYYLTPKIEKNNMLNAIDNYNFEAYIPTLIPLLTGNNIYAKKEVFARELIQNAIDAIAVRASKDKEFDQTIYITLGEEQGRQFFRIKDYGTGMDRFKIERYFTSIGRSFYSGDEYRDLDIDYKPISNFGIGFLSAFMICREIEVRTKYYLDEMEGLRLHIPNYDGCFFIEKEDISDIGTEITLYIDKVISNNISTDNIIEYIVETMQDISCDILIKNEMANEEVRIESKSIRRNRVGKDFLFVPFQDTGKIIEGISVEKILSKEEYVTEYPYGLLIDLSGKCGSGIVMNSGIELSHTNVMYVWRMLFGYSMLFGSRIGMSYALEDFCFFNFPSNCLNIDVSREKVASFTDKIDKTDFGKSLMSEIIRQINEYTQLCNGIETENPAINLQCIIVCLKNLCKNIDGGSHLENKLMDMSYTLYVCFNEDKLDLIVCNQSKKIDKAYKLENSNYSKIRNALRVFISARSKNSGNSLSAIEAEFKLKIAPILDDLVEMFISYSEFYSDEQDVLVFEQGDLFVNPELLEGMCRRISISLREKLKVENNEGVCAILLFYAFCVKSIHNKNAISIVQSVLYMLLERYSVSEVENGKCIISIQREQIIRVLKRIK